MIILNYELYLGYQITSHPNPKSHSSLVTFPPNQLAHPSQFLTFASCYPFYLPVISHLNYCVQSHTTYDCVGYLLHVTETLVPTEHPCAPLYFPVSFAVNLELYDFYCHYIYIRYSYTLCFHIW